MKYKVECKTHNYNTDWDMTEGTAVTAARMHSLLPCSEVKVLNEQNEEFDWRGAEFGATI